MSDQPGRENIEDDLSTYSVDGEDQLQPEDTLVGSGDPLDEGYQTPDRLHGSLAFGTTAEEQSQEETIEQRIHQEVPDPDTAYGAPDNESGLDAPEMAGGDEPDAIPAERDFVGDERDAVGQLISPDAGAEQDTEKDEIAHSEPAVDSGSPEEQAMHTVLEDDPTQR
ncbi:MAG: DUF5709 domain-containing protein [Ornithinimicrobium sp.]|jgi:hypothetical protein|uniref:DUF5709 domain-containing protein n=1 Tax=Ornithinimicrobium sp. TaxID=1977084 RepID=UPI003D9ABBBE